MAARPGRPAVAGTDEDFALTELLDDRTTGADGARRGLGIELPQVDAAFGDVFDDVVEVVSFDGLDGPEDVIGYPAEATVDDLGGAIGGSVRNERGVRHLEISL